DRMGHRQRGDWALGSDRPDRIVMSRGSERCFVIAANNTAFDIAFTSTQPPEPVLLCESFWRITGAAPSPDGKTLAFVAASSRQSASECFLWGREARCRFWSMTLPDVHADAVAYIRNGSGLVIGSHLFKSSQVTSVRFWDFSRSSYAARTTQQ